MPAGGGGPEFGMTPGGGENAGGVWPIGGGPNPGGNGDPIPGGGIPRENGGTPGGIIPGGGKPGGILSPGGGGLHHQRSTIETSGGHVKRTLTLEGSQARQGREGKVDQA